LANISAAKSIGVSSTTFSERELTFKFSIHTLYMSSFVCLSSVRNVRAAYSGDWSFRQYVYAIW